MLQFIFTILTKQPWFTKIYKDAWIKICLSWLLSYLWYISPTFYPHQRFFTFSFTFFFKKEQKKIPNIISTSPPSEMKITSPLYFTLLRPHSTSSVPLPHCRPNNPSSHIHTSSHPNIQNEKQKLKRIQTEQNKSPPESSAAGKSSPLLRADHHFRDEVDDGRGRLIGVHLRKQVTDVVCRAALLSGHKAKEPVKKKNVLY